MAACTGIAELHVHGATVIPSNRKSIPLHIDKSYNEPRTPNLLCIHLPLPHVPCQGLEQMVYQGSRAVAAGSNSSSTSTRTAEFTSSGPACPGCLHAPSTAATDVFYVQLQEKERAGCMAGKKCGCLVRRIPTPLGFRVFKMCCCRSNVW